MRPSKRKLPGTPKVKLDASYKALLRGFRKTLRREFGVSKVREKYYWGINDWKDHVIK